MVRQFALQVEDLSVSYRSRIGTWRPGQSQVQENVAVSSASFSVESGQTVAIVGESGSGKTTLAKSIIGLLPTNAAITGGQIFLAGPEQSRDLRSLSPKEWYGIRGRDIGWIPQDPTTSLNPLKTIGQAVAESLHIHQWQDAPSRRRRVLELLERVGLDDPELRATQFPHQLSGGMRQRALIASAIALKPRLIIADEPTSALDVTVQKRILDLIDELRGEYGASVILITHDLAVAGQRADQLVVMESGKIRESGSPLSVMKTPIHTYTQQLLADAPAFSASPARMIAVGDTLLKVSNLRQEFGGKGRDPFVAVNGVSFSVPEGSTHAIVGESGSGKTTTGRAVALFRQPTAGQIIFDGEDISHLNSGQRRRLRTQIQLVQQNPHSALDPRQKIGEIIGEPLVNYRRRFGFGGNASEFPPDRRGRRTAVLEMLDRLGLPNSVYGRRPAELSGGQLQRVAIGRALILQPRLVVFDEAVSALDVTVQAQILRLLQQLQADLGLTYLFISHDLAVVRSLAQSVSVLRGGQQVECDSVEQIFASPQHEYTQQLIQSVPIFEDLVGGSGSGDPGGSGSGDPGGSVVEHSDVGAAVNPGLAAVR